jgi:dihydropteroate synthase
MTSISLPTPETRHWQCGQFRLALDRPLVMGIVNATPDSFSEGGRYAGFDAALAHAHALRAQGADILDIGGESTRPGAQEVEAAEELRRVLPLVRALRDCAVPLSVDTSKPQVMQTVLAEGAAIINDVRALRVPGAVEAVRGADCGVVLMHMQGEPRTMQAAPTYADVVDEVQAFLDERVAACVSAGISRRRIAIDPGFGFGKRVEHNLALLRALPRLAAAGLPLLVGISRKATIGALTGRSEPADRVAGSVAAALWAATRGAHIVRVHDVAATRDALTVWRCLEEEQ